MTNFAFLRDKPRFSEFSEACCDAENAMAISYATSAMQARRALELAVKWVYAYDSALTVPYQDNLSALIHDHTFKSILDSQLFVRIKFIVQLGNRAAHTARALTRIQAVEALHCLFEFVAWIDYCYSDTINEAAFDPALLPDKDLAETRTRTMQQELERLQAELAAKDKALEELLKPEPVREAFSQKRDEHRKTREFKPQAISEFSTRKIYIDLMLESAGWTIGRNCLEEVAVTGMPSSRTATVGVQNFEPLPNFEPVPGPAQAQASPSHTGKGYVDYVLYGENGLPVAVVEAKRTSVDPKLGKVQARLYADCLEREHGVRPFIFYTNGFSTHFWDDAQDAERGVTGYPERRVSGFFTPAEFAWFRQRNAQKQPLDAITPLIKESITNRHYQKAAIQAVCETLAKGHRKALLVMATGAGKTRTAISLVDVLSRQGWIKNVLFLADRRELVKQAKKNFTAQLPNLSICNLLDDKDNPESRMVFSTYATIMNAIDSTKSKDGSTLFTPGHFDLIIIDEAHRSIYKKYQDIFSYFDSYLVGLTATPKTDIDHNTYGLFELENDVPTYAYELADAVAENFLVTYSSHETTLKFLEQGISYDELSEAEQAQWEDTFEEGTETISSEDLNRFLFNAHTIDTVLQDLHAQGLKVQGGDRIGKTIIFAANTKHADAILNRFDQLYPNHAGKAAGCIYNGIKYVDSVLDDFSTKDKLPQIAISVDMLDTGIDIPELLNLVFFKKVRSKAKFWQMIGRGTRLCPDLFGIGDDKKAFRIFDYCGNFEYFRTAKNLSEGKAAKSLTEQLFGVRLRIARELQHLKYQQPEAQAFRTDLIASLFQEVSRIDRSHFSSRLRIEYLDRYQPQAAWDNLTEESLSELEKHLAPLISSSEDDELAKRFDYLMYSIMLTSLQAKSNPQQRQKLVSTGEALAEKGHLEKVRKQAQIINRIQQPAYWQEADLFEHETVRLALRDLLDLIERSSQETYYTNFTDAKLQVNENAAFYGGYDFRSYRAKVNAYFKDHSDELTIHKLRHNKPLTLFDLRHLEKLLWQDLGTEQEYKREFGDEPLMTLVARLAGLDRSAALELFSEFLADHSLNSHQISFVNHVVEHVVKNGSLDKVKLNHAPFNHFGDLASLFNDRIGTIQNIVKKIEQLNARLQLG